VAHVFVETNWLFAYAAPAHYRIPEAVELLDRARGGEFTLHMPNACFGEARQAIRTKCQPRNEADAIRRFLAWAQPAGCLTAAEARATMVSLDKYESNIKGYLENLDDAFRNLANLPCFDVYGLDDGMLNRATDLALAGIAAKPFDHAILASVLVRAAALWAAGERVPKPPLRDAYDEAHVWVYGDFTLTLPPRRFGFE
jgi:hypothetical protein